MDGIVMMTPDDLEKTHGEAIRNAKKERHSARKVIRAEEARFQARLRKRREMIGERTISRAEAALHCRAGDGYLVIGGSVYDVTGWLDLHPGGPILTKYLGRDATRAFKDNGHSPLARMQLADLLVGDLPLVENVQRSQPGDTSSDEAGSSDDDGSSRSRPAPDRTLEKEEKEKPQPEPQVRRRRANRYRKPGEYTADQVQDESIMFSTPETAITWGVRAAMARLQAEMAVKIARQTLAKWWAGRDRLVRAWPLVVGGVCFAVSAAHIRLPPLQAAADFEPDRDVWSRDGHAGGGTTAVGGQDWGQDGRGLWGSLGSLFADPVGEEGHRHAPEEHDPKAVMYY